MWKRPNHIVSPEIPEHVWLKNWQVAELDYQGGQMSIL